MTGERDELRAHLDEIAAAAGDPPEHGLDGVVARRRRRTRHRRGAVATAMALAVFGVVALPWVTGLQGGHDVTAGSPDGRASGSQVEMPDVVELFCDRGTIDVPVASIRPQRDGLHLDVVNRLGRSTEAWVTSQASDEDEDEGRGWSSGRFPVPTGTTTLVLAAPPGPLTVGCDTGDADQQRQVDLVDVEGLWTAPELDCPPEERDVRTEPVPVTKETPSLPTAARSALGEEQLPFSDQLRAFSGYPEGETEWGSHTADPVVQVVRDGETVAFVHLLGAGQAGGLGGGVGDAGPGAGPTTSAPEASDPAAIPATPTSPWSAVSLVELCPAFVTEPDTDPPPGHA